MAKYGGLERSLAAALNSMPQFKKKIKTIYQTINYLLYRSEEEVKILNEGTRLYSIYEWIGASQEEKDNQVFFGYYDKSPWSTDGEKVIAQRIEDQNELEITIFDRNRKELIAVDRTNTWSTQQGAMLQWFGKNRDQIIYNRLVDGNHSARIVTKEGEIVDTLPWPVQCVSPTGTEYVSINYSRLWLQNPEYGYSVKGNNFSSEFPLDEDGIWRVSVASGEAKLIFSLSEIVAHSREPQFQDARHEVNHVMYSPNGERIVFMHRWRIRGVKYSRLFVATLDGGNLNLLMNDQMVSHYCWLNNETLVVWGRDKALGDHYYILDTDSKTKTILGEGEFDIYGDGHPSLSPAGRYLLTDSYPDKARYQNLMIYDFRKNRVIPLGKFLAPLKFVGYKRCDLHPRWSLDGSMISIDSVHKGKRMLYVVELDESIEK